MDKALNMRTYTLQIPESDARFFSAFVKKMGWTKKRISNSKNETGKTGLEIALEEVEKGDLESFNSVEALMDYLHS